MSIGNILFAGFRLSFQDNGVESSSKDSSEGATISAIIAKVMNLERGLARRFSIEGGSRCMVFSM